MRAPDIGQGGGAYFPGRERIKGKVGRGLRPRREYRTAIPLPVTGGGGGHGKNGSQMGARWPRWQAAALNQRLGFSE